MRKKGTPPKALRHTRANLDGRLLPWKWMERDLLAATAGGLP